MVFKDGGDENTMLNFLIPDLRVSSGANWDVNLQFKDNFPLEVKWTHKLTVLHRCEVITSLNIKCKVRLKLATQQQYSAHSSA